MKFDGKRDRKTHEQISIELFKILPKDQIQRVFNQYMVDIEPEFLGFVGTYYYLSRMIPDHFTIIDLGCAYNPQCFYFTKHKKYLAVDLPLGVNKIERFQANNCEIFEMPMRDFIEEHISDLKLEECFAICNYVPDWPEDNRKLVRETFDNCYVYYPHGGYDAPRCES